MQKFYGSTWISFGGMSLNCEINFCSSTARQLRNGRNYRGLIYLNLPNLPENLGKGFKTTKFRHNVGNQTRYPRVGGSSRANTHDHNVR
jgi:hypothetical protein